MKKYNLIIAYILIAILVLGENVSSNTINAAERISITKSVTITVGKKKKIKVKHNKNKTKWSVIKGKKNIKLFNKNKKDVTVKGIKKGTAKVQAKIGKKKYACTVNIKAKKVVPRPGNLPSPTHMPTPKTMRYDGNNIEDIRDAKESVAVIIADSVTTLQDYEFSYCTNMVSILIPNSVVEIGHGIFRGCNNLLSVSVSDNNEFYDSRNGCNAII